MKTLNRKYDKRKIVTICYTTDFPRTITESLWTKRVTAKPLLKAWYLIGISRCHKAFLTWEPGAGLLPRHAWRLQKCLGSPQHSPKERCRRWEPGGTASWVFVLSTWHRCWASLLLTPAHKSRDTPNLILVLKNTAGWNVSMSSVLGLKLEWLDWFSL